MLARALKPNFEGLRDAAKQILIWSLNKKAEFCTSGENYDVYPKKNRFSKRNDYFEDSYERDDFDNYSFDDKRKSYRSGSDFYQEGNHGGNKFFKRKQFNSFTLQETDVVFSEALTPIVRDFYQPHPDVLNSVGVTPVEDKFAFESGFCLFYNHCPSKLKQTKNDGYTYWSAQEIQDFRNKHDIQIFGKKKEDCPPPIFRFEELNLPNNVFEVIRNLNYCSPTPVQSQTWPIALSGQNMVGISQTGSGKTLGFVLPALLHLTHQPPLKCGEGPIALVIAPTRELVQQILSVITPFAVRSKIRVATLFGGASKSFQVRRLLQGVEICVATPGRLNDVLKDNYIKLNRCSYFVLDEADRLLDMGFHPQIKSIFHYCRPDRQVLMWSATWPKEVQSLAEMFLKDNISVKFGSAELTANPNIRQFVHVCEERNKFALLKNILEKINENQDNKTIIFAQTKLKADSIGYMLKREGYRTVIIHGDKSQNMRDRALNMFRDGSVKILVGTLVVGRGIDIDDIRYVINYDFPNDIEDYVHIIGRTARSNNHGTSHSFFTFNDQSKAADLINILNQSNQPITPELKSMVRIRRKPKNSVYNSEF